MPLLFVSEYINAPQITVGLSTSSSVGGSGSVGILAILGSVGMGNLSGSTVGIQVKL